MRVLHAAAECFPFVKTGGLGDVVGALPQALSALGAEVRLVLPGLPLLCAALHEATDVATIPSPVGPGELKIRLGTLVTSHGARGLPTYLVEAPALYARDGGPYQDSQGRDWPDNLERFTVLSTIAARLAAGQIDPLWRADVLHTHDWHTALACAVLRRLTANHTRSVFTIHNLAYAGLFPLDRFAMLELDPKWSYPGAALEFYGQLSLLKAGLVLADRVTTVSPTYAREIAMPENGQGFDGLIRARGAEVSGILNGIDTTLWDPNRDAALPAPFSAADLSGKRRCRSALLDEFALPGHDGRAVFAIVSRFSHQKGLDLVLDAWPELERAGARLIVLGNGDPALEAAFRRLAASYPASVAVSIGYDEARAHRLIAGADALLVPSRFEPCGLTQLYALRYGTLPVVRRVGGLADTIDEQVGFLFGPHDEGFTEALSATLAARTEPRRWASMQQAAMAREHGWETAARRYLALYRSL